MKKFNVVIFTGLLMMILVACGGNENAEDIQPDEEASNEMTELEYEPVDINPEADVCEICAMAVADDQHATQIVLKDHRPLKFDDLGCLYEWVEENGEDEIGAKFVRDYNTEEWVLLENATYVFDENIETPMAYGIISFKEEEDAEDYIEENGYGELLTADDLGDHKWEMMDHDHDHGHDHDHSHHDHEHGHGFHTEGFDMYFTELESVSVGEEMELEVHLTLDDEALENARVRYEIWNENEEDNRDWIEATEISPGNYVAGYTFEGEGTYHIQVHVEDDEDLHEHVDYEVNVEG